MLFFTADPHFGHANIMRYCQRPFASVEAMDAALIERWNARVGADDDIYILGDFTLKKQSETVRGYVQALKGNKHLIVGNHDLFVKGERADKWRDVFCEISDYRELQAPSGYTYILMHYPIMFWNGSIDPRVIHLYGHIHNNPYCNAQTAKLSNALNVGCDLHNYTPISEAEVLTLVAAHNGSIKDSINGSAPKDGPLKTHATPL